MPSESQQPRQLAGPQTLGEGEQAHKNETAKKLRCSGRRCANECWVFTRTPFYPPPQLVGQWLPYFSSSAFTFAITSKASAT
jgi:hypothetical protein